VRRATCAAVVVDEDEDCRSYHAVVPEPCMLCQAEQITPWHHEDASCWIADCSVCGVPMVVWRQHDPDPPAEVRAHLVAELTRVADARLGPGAYRIDQVMRRIPDHFHAHARTSWWRG